MSKREGGDGGEKVNEQEGGGRWRRERGVLEANGSQAFILSHRSPSTPLLSLHHSHSSTPSTRYPATIRVSVLVRVCVSIFASLSLSLSLSLCVCVWYIAFMFMCLCFISVCVLSCLRMYNKKQTRPREGSGWKSRHS